MGFFTIVIVAVSALQLTNAQRDYCTIASCSGKTHVGCPIPTPPATTACSSFTPITYSASQIELALSNHNQKRNLVASGNAISTPTSGAAPFNLPKATDMKKLTWEDELVLVASYNVRQCKMAHDACRNTDAYCGQNLYKSMHSGSGASTIAPETTITKAIDSWYNEINQFDLPQINSFTGANGVGHFTQEIWASTVKVGCAGAKWFDGSWWHYLIACNYKVGGNYLGNKIYTQGAVSASACTATDPVYTNLCI